MEFKVYVGNLPYAATEEDLQTMFMQAGTVKSVTLIKDRDTGRSKGFAFVEMSSEEEAQQAITMFNGSKLMERALTVNLARPRQERDGDDFRRGGNRFNKPFRNTGGGRR